MVKLPRSLVLEEVGLQSVVPTLYEVVGVDPSISNSLMVAEHPPPLI